MKKLKLGNVTWEYTVSSPPLNAGDIDISGGRHYKVTESKEFKEFKIDTEEGEELCSFANSMGGRIAAFRLLMAINGWTDEDLTYENPELLTKKDE
jgi:hypothetical protein